MATFKFTFERTVTTTDTCEREIEADSLEAAQEIADAMASEFNQSCPDDVEAGDYFECDAWEASPDIEAIRAAQATPVDDRAAACGEHQTQGGILPGNAPYSASEEIPHHDEAESPIASEAAPEAEIDAIAEPVAGMWRARLATPNFTFEAFGLDIASARRALEQGLTRHARQYGLEPGWWHDFAGGIEIYFVRDSAAYCDGDLIRERGARD